MKQLNARCTCIYCVERKDVSALLRFTFQISIGLLDDRLRKAETWDDRARFQPFSLPHLRRAIACMCGALQYLHYENCRWCVDNDTRHL